MPAGIFPWIALAVAGAVLGGGVWVHVWCVKPALVITPAGEGGGGSVLCTCLGWCPTADSDLVWAKGHDKLGAEVTQESHKLWY
jgi:hypothetical protein